MKLMVCGSRKKGYGALVSQVLDSLKSSLDLVKEELIIIHGDCKGSADEYAEEWAKENSDGAVEGAIGIVRKPGKPGTYLKRNIEMVQKCDLVIAFWDGFSYGTAHSIATAVAYGKKVRVRMIT